MHVRKKDRSVSDTKGCKIRRGEVSGEEAVCQIYLGGVCQIDRRRCVSDEEGLVVCQIGKVRCLSDRQTEVCQMEVRQIDR